MRFEDERGHLEIVYETNEVVVKRSFSYKGVFRGLHRQLFPHQQTKLIRVVKGEILDFQYDPKTHSNEIDYLHIKTGSEWIEVHSSLAHGFLALEETLFEYICIGAYNANSEVTLNITDSVKNKFKTNNLILSDKDKIGKKVTINKFNKLNVQ